MNKTELLKAIKKAKAIFVGSALTHDDVYYVQVTKPAMLRAIERLTDAEFNATMREDGDLYLN